MLIAWSPPLITTTATPQQQQISTTTPGGTASSPPSQSAVPPSSTTMSSSLTPITPPLTPQEQEQQTRLQNVIASTTLHLQETQKQISGVVFTPRWSQPLWINASSVAVLVAYCLPGEFADSGQEILGGFELEVLESYALALPQGFMVWMAVVGNEADIQNGKRFPAALGVICASDLNKPETRVLSPDTQQVINNINQQFVNIQNTQITDIDNVINIINNVTTTTTTPPPLQNGTQGSGTTTVAAAPVQDTTPPVITVPEDIIVNATSEQGAQVFYTVTAQDNVDGEATLDENNILTQDNNATVFANVDGAPPMQGAGGNTGAMTPSQAPPSQATTPTPSSPNQPPAAGGGDITGDITITCNPPSGSTFPIGTTDVECEAADSQSNVERNILNVCINDNANVCESPVGAPAQEDGEPPIIVDEDATSLPGVLQDIPLLQAPPPPEEQPSEDNEGEEGDSSNEQSADGDNMGDLEQDEQNEQTNTLQTGDNTATTTQEGEEEDDTSGD
jgi:hypothetical protein